MSADSQEPPIVKSPRIPSRRRLLKALGGVAGTTALTIASAELALPHIPYDTDPYDIRDSTIWRLFRGPSGGIMRLCGAEDKDSNYWQWKKTEVPEFRPSALLKGNYDTFVRRGTLDNIRMSCDGIHEVYVLTPPPEVTWRLIFQTVHLQDEKLIPYESEGNLFTGKLSGSVKFLRGNGDVLIYAVDDQGKRIPLSKQGPFPREDPSLAGRLI